MTFLWARELHAFSRIEQIVTRGGSDFMCQILLILSFKSEEVYLTCHHWRGTMVLRSWSVRNVKLLPRGWQGLLKRCFSLPPQHQSNLLCLSWSRPHCHLAWGRGRRCAVNPHSNGPILNSSSILSSWAGLLFSTVKWDLSLPATGVTVFWVDSECVL